MGCLCCKEQTGKQESTVKLIDTFDSNNIEPIENSNSFDIFYNQMYDSRYTVDLETDAKKPYDLANIKNFLNCNFDNNNFSVKPEILFNLSREEQLDKFIFDNRTILLFCAFKADLVLTNDIDAEIKSIYEIYLSNWKNFIMKIFGLIPIFLIKEANPDQMALFMMLFLGQNNQNMDYSSLLKIGVIARIFYSNPCYDQSYNKLKKKIFITWMEK